MSDPHQQFECAGDAEAAEFCNEIANRMVEKFGIAWDEAVARIDEQWSGAGRNRIVGLDIVYHEDVDHWASDIYFGHDSAWWVPDTDPPPLPPPPRE